VTRGRTLTISAIVAPSVVLAGLGFTHPHDLVSGNASWWMILHLILMPLFPLLGLSIWIVLRGEKCVLAWSARGFALLYVVFYGALDSIVGVGVGSIMVATGAASSQDVAAIAPLYSIGNKLGLLGAICFLVAGILAVGTLARRRPRWSLFVPGAAVLLLADVFFLRSHIYWPVGVFVVFGIGLGLALLEVSPRRNSSKEYTD
jgi:hypothetical protein